MVVGGTAHPLHLRVTSPVASIPRPDPSFLLVLRNLHAREAADAQDLPHPGLGAAFRHTVFRMLTVTVNGNDKYPFVCKQKFPQLKSNRVP